MLCLSVSLTQLISFQDVRDHFQKQDASGVLWELGIGEISFGARIFFCLASGDRRPPSDPDRRFRLVRLQHRNQAPVGSAFTWHGVWYVVALIPVGGVKFRGSLTMWNT